MVYDPNQVSAYTIDPATGLPEGGVPTLQPEPYSPTNLPKGTPDARGNYYDENGRVIYSTGAGTPTTSASSPIYRTTPTPTGTTTDTTDTNPMTSGQYNEEYNSFRVISNQYATGSIPLTPAQQAILDSTRALAESVHNQQLEANKAFEGGMRVYNERMGLTQNSARIAMGNIKAATDEGLAKLQDLDAKSSQALATMQNAFQQDNYKAATDAWTAFQKYAKDKNDVLVANQKAVQDAKDKMDKDVYERFTKPIEDIAIAAAKNGARQEQLDAIKNAKSIQEAIAAAGTWLQTGTGTLGEWIQYRNENIAAGKPYTDYPDWIELEKKKEDQREANKAYNAAYGAAKGKAAAEAEAAATPEAKAGSVKQIKTAQNALKGAKDLAYAAGRGTAYEWAKERIFGATEYTNLQAYANTLRSQMLTLATDPGIKKFFGPQMSNADVQFMMAGGTTLNPELQNPAQFKDELDRIESFLIGAKAAAGEELTTREMAVREEALAKEKVLEHGDANSQDAITITQMRADGTSYSKILEWILTQ